MIQREHMMGKEPLRRAGWDVAHDCYRLIGCLVANASVGRALVFFLTRHRAVLAGRPYVGLVYFDLDCICGSPWPLKMARPSVDYVVNKITVFQSQSNRIL